MLKLNASEGAAARALPVNLDFLSNYPDMRVDLIADGNLVDIVAAGFDAGIRLAESVPRDMVSISFGTTEAFVAVAAPSYLSQVQMPQAPVDLLRHDCLKARLPSGRLVDWEFERGGRVERVDVSGRLILGTTELTLTAALAGAGVAYVPLWDAEKAIGEGRLVRLLADWTPPYEGICLYYPRLRLPSAGLRAFIDHLKASRRHLAGGP